MHVQDAVEACLVVDQRGLEWRTNQKLYTYMYTWGTRFVVGLNW